MAAKHCIGLVPRKRLGGNVTSHGGSCDANDAVLKFKDLLSVVLEVQGRSDQLVFDDAFAIFRKRHE